MIRTLNLIWVSFIDKLCSKYQFMQVNTDRRALGLREKLPDIQKTLDTVRFLKTRKVGRCFEG
jgi:hypothetical protein